MTTGQQPDLVRDAREKPKRDAEALAAQAVKDAPLAVLMSTPAGRQFVNDDLLAPLWKTAGRSDTSNRWDDVATARAVGLQDAARELLARLEGACPDSVVAMVREALDRRKNK
jgi:hypothetical protein